MMRRRLLPIVAVIVLTWVFGWILGHIHWPENVGIAVSRMSGMVGGIGIEDTENLFLLLCLLVAFVLALALVTIIGRLIRKDRI